MKQKICFVLMAFGLIGSSPLASAAGVGVDSTTGALALAFGSSLPASMQATTEVDATGPSRLSGGEYFDIQFKNAKTVTSVTLTAFSTSGSGQVLVRNVLATTTDATGSTAFALGDLFDFADKGAGLYNDYQGLVMLANNNYVTTNVNQVLTDLKFQLEGFSNNDATILIQVNTIEAINYYDFSVTRQAVSPQPPPPPPPPPGGGSATYQWVGSDCDLVTPDGDIVATEPYSYCSGATYQWVQSDCDLVTPDGYIVANEPISYCPGATYQWVGSNCDLVTPQGYIVGVSPNVSYCEIR